MSEKSFLISVCAVVFIKKDIEEFVGEAEQFDDITMLLLELEPR